MSWGYVGAAAVTVVGGALLGGRGGDGGAAMQSIAQNQAIAKHNMSQIVRNHYVAGMREMQFGLQKRQMAQEGFETGKAALVAMGSVTANQAASGTIGHSADAVMQDIEMKLGEAQAVQQDNFEMAVLNYNNELDAQRMNALNEVVQEQQFVGKSNKNPWRDALIQGALQLGGAYFQNKMSLGLGPKATSQSGIMQGLSMNSTGQGLRMGGGQGLRL